MKNNFIKKRLFRIVGIFIFIIILWRLDIDQVLDNFVYLQFKYIVLGLFLLIALHVIKAFRWQYILKIQGITYSWLDCYLMYTAGFYLGILTPGRIGDFAKIYYIKKKDFSFARSLLTNIIDRFLDLLLLFMIASISFIWFVSLFDFNFKRIQFLILFIFVILIISISFILFKKEKIIPIFKKAIPKKYYIFFDKGKKEMSYDLHKYSKLKIINLLIFTLVGWFFYFISIYLFSLSLNLQIRFSEVILFFTFSTIVTFLPLTIAGIGTRDLTLIGLFSKFGYIKEDAISFSLIILLIYLLTAIFGFVSFLISPIKIHNDVK